MNRNYATFADLCMLMSGGQSWALDMQQRGGNPALLAYLVNSITHLLVGKSAIPEQFRRSSDGVVIAAANEHADLAQPPIVHLALKYAKKKLIKDGCWIPDMAAVVEKACPEIARAVPGDIVEHDAAGHWSIALAQGDWMPSVAIDRGVDLESGNAPAR